MPDSQTALNVPVEFAELFEQDLAPHEFEYFQKHLEAYKTYWNMQPIRERICFIDAFYLYSEMFGYIRDFPSKIEVKREIFTETKLFLIDNYAAGRFSAAKTLVFEIAVISENRERFSQSAFGSMPRAKDPFYNVETRRTFRKFFGEPQHTNIYQKAVVTMGLYTKFGGAICRSLRKWVEGEIMQSEPQLETIKRMAQHTEHKEKEGGAGCASCEKEKKAKETAKKAKKEKSNQDANAGKSSEENSRNPIKIKGFFANNVAQEAAKKSKPDVTQKSTVKCHHCSGCLQVEAKPNTYKKCAWCKGKNTSFYCSKKCQIEDWQTRHREEHMKRGHVYRQE